MIKKEFKIKLELNKELGFNSLKGILEKELKPYDYEIKLEVLK